MPKLLVNQPSGKQEIIEIAQTGDYFEPSRVVWDERTDGTLPAVTLGKMQRANDQLITLPDYLPAHVAVILADAKTAKIAELKAAFDAENYADIEHNSIIWRSDKDSQKLLAEVLTPGSVPEGMYWRDADEIQHAMAFTDLQALGRAILDRGLLLDSKFETKRALVIAAQTIEEVNSINWN